ncbi:MAG: hypothetical protein ACI4MI_03825 [Christensenellales bacterium]
MNKKFLFKIVLILLLSLSLFLLTGQVCAESDDPMEELKNDVEQNAADLDLDQLQDWLQRFDNQGLSNLKSTIIVIANGEMQWTFEDAVSMLTDGFFSSFKSVLPIVVCIIGIALICSILNSLTGSFLSNPTKEIINFVCYCAVALIVLGKTISLITTTGTIVGDMKDFMQLVFPVLLTLITVLGGVSSGAVFKPMMSVLATSITVLVSDYILPLVIAVTVFTLISSLSENIKLSKITGFFNSGIKYVLGAVFSLFITFLTAQGLTCGIIDTVSVKTAKFAVQSYVPIVGGYLSDGFDLMMASFVLIKNSLGLVSLTAIFLLIVSPLVEIIVFSLGLKLAAGVVEPLTNSRISKMLYDLSKNLNVLVAIILGVAFMFIITVMLIIYACNLGVV